MLFLGTNQTEERKHHNLNPTWNSTRFNSFCLPPPPCHPYGQESSLTKTKLNGVTTQKKFLQWRIIGLLFASGCFWHNSYSFWFPLSVLFYFRSLFACLIHQLVCVFCLFLYIFSLLQLNYFEHVEKSSKQENSLSTEINITRVSWCPISLSQCQLPWQQCLRQAQ